MAENSIKKARYWWAVLYQENMVDNWQDEIADTVQLPFAYCEHNKCTDAKSEHRKDHIHLILVFPNTTTYSHALNVFKLLGEKSVNTCKAVVNIRNAYDYLIHDTAACRKAGKHLYDPSERICGNNFDIGSYEQISIEEKHERLDELVKFIRQNKYMDISTFTVDAIEFFGKEYWEIIIAYNATLDRYCKSEYLKWERRQRIQFWSSAKDCSATDARPTENQPKCCTECGSIAIKKIGKTAAGTQRFKCKDCGKKFI